MRQELAHLLTTQEKLNWLREQIEMRVIGLCWVEFKAQWSSTKDEEVGTIEDLTGGRSTRASIHCSIVCIELSLNYDAHG